MQALDVADHRHTHVRGQDPCLHAHTLVPTAARHHDHAVDLTAAAHATTTDAEEGHDPTRHPGHVPGRGLHRPRLTNESIVVVVTAAGVVAEKAINVDEGIGVPRAVEAAVVTGVIRNEA